MKTPDKPESAAASKPRIAVSACLLGQPVRYDGKDKNCTDLQSLAEHCELVPVCPEVGMGLPVPRPPIEVWHSPRGLGLRQVDQPEIELSQTMRQWFERHKSRWQALDGCVLKSRSPSCGVGSTPVFTASGQEAETADGLFVALLRECFPQLVLLDENAVQIDSKRQAFLHQVKARHQARMQADAEGPVARSKKA